MASGSMRKGISPLIASVLLVAFSLSAGTLFSPFITQMIQGNQRDTDKSLERVSTAADLDLELRSADYNISKGNLTVTGQNTGDKIGNATNISLSLISTNPVNKEFDKDLASKEVFSLKVNAEDTYGIDSLDLSLTGYPVSVGSGVECLPTRKLEAYWTFNDGQTDSGFARDISGNNQDGEIKNGVGTGKNSIIGESYDFTTGNDYVLIGDTIEPNRVTLSAWANPDDPSKTTQTLVSEAGDFGDNDQYFLALSDSKWRFGVDTGSGLQTVETGAIAKKGEWRHVTGVYNGTHSMVYVNGKRKAIGSQSGDIKEGDADLEIGSEDNADDDLFDGRIDEVRIYSRGISSEENMRLYNAQSKNLAINTCKLN